MLSLMTAALSFARLDVLRGAEEWSAPDRRVVGRIQVLLRANPSGGGSQFHRDVPTTG